MKTSIFKSLYVQVLTAIAIGILLGHFYGTGRANETLWRRLR